MSAQSDRIRAALQRSETARQSGPPRLAPGEELNIAVNDENLAVLMGPKAPSDESPTVESRVVEEPPPEVESTLPLIAASDKSRTAFRRVEPAPSPIAAKSETPGAKSEAPAAKLEAPITKLETLASGSRRMLLIVAGVAIVLVGLAALLLRNHWSSPKRSAQTSPSSLPLQVKAEPQSDGLINVRWNSQSELITQAREGRLVISEPNQQPRAVTLNSEQLKSGHVYYQSSGDRVEFRLEVVNRSGVTSQESVVTLSSKPAAAPPVETPPVAAHAASAPTNVPNVPAIAANSDAPQVAEVSPAPQPARPVARPYVPPQQKQPSPGSASEISLDPLPPVSPGAAIPSGAGLADRLNRIPAPQAVAPRIHVGGSVQAAKLIKQVKPEYPALARAARARGAVRFTATIGKDGRIKNLQLVSGNPTLVPAATDAVKQWVYQPSLLNGEPVEVITQIDVDFSMSQ